MLETANKGLAGARNIYGERSKRAEELRKEGKKVIGYLCLYPVIEMLTAFDLVPYRMFGDMKEPITKADTYMPSIVCPFLRSLLDFGLKGRYDFLDGVVMAHICDVGAQMHEMWNGAEIMRNAKELLERRTKTVAENIRIGNCMPGS